MSLKFITKLVAGCTAAFGLSFSAQAETFDKWYMNDTSWYATAISDNSTSYKIAQFGSGLCAFKVRVEKLGETQLLVRMPNESTCAEGDGSPHHLWASVIGNETVFFSGMTSPWYYNDEEEDGFFAYASDGKGFRLVTTTVDQANSDISRSRLRFRFLDNQKGKLFIETYSKSKKSWSTSADISLNRFNGKAWPDYKIPNSNPPPRVCRTVTGKIRDCPTKNTKR